MTGANGGLGPAVVSALRGAGAQVLTAARSGDVTLRADLTVEGAAVTLVKQAGRLDGVIHVMGAFAGGQTVDETPGEVFRQMMAVNFFSAVSLFQAALPELRRSHAGRLIAIGSRAVQVPMAQTAAYAASKAALTSLVQTIAAEAAGSGLTANIVSPGTIDTEANRSAMPGADTSQWIRPEAIGELAVWLCSDAGGAVNGQVLPLYGS